jgi:HK97 family phage major capsid protein
MVELAKSEKRELTEDEQCRKDEIKAEIKSLEAELKELEDKENENPNEDVVPTDEENKSKRSMKKQFSLLGAIRSVVDNKPMDEITRAMVEAGKQEMRGMTANGQIQLPVEQRTITVTGEGGEHDDVVSTDLFDVLRPLQNKLALADAGTRFLTGLVGDVQYPIMSNGSAAWEGEITEADDANITFSNVKLQPHRLSATIEVSKQFIMQDSTGAEMAIRDEIVEAIAQKLEATIFGNANTSGQPQGIFYGSSDTVSDFAGICEMEADLEEAKVLGPYKYVMSPKAKAALRGMIKGTCSVGMVYENEAVDGVPAISTGLITGKKVAVGDWGHTVLGQWGGIDLVVDPYTKAKNASVVITINAWFDFKVLREGAIKTYTITGGDESAS